MPLLHPQHAHFPLHVAMFSPLNGNFLLKTFPFCSNMAGFWTSFSLIVCQRNGSEKKAFCVGKGLLEISYKVTCE